MLVIPAIDIRHGKCVRLYKGKPGSETVYFEDPRDALAHWIGKGAEFIHIVDLDGAFGEGNNFELIGEMIRIADPVKIEVGGGIRTVEIAEKFYGIGVERIIVGTAALSNPDFVAELSDRFGRNFVVVDIAVTPDGRPAVRGWTGILDTDAFSAAENLCNKGAGYVLISSVDRDGTFAGPDIKNTEKMVNSVSVPVIAAGGVADIGDLIMLKEIGVYATVVGKALYEGKIDYTEVMKVL